MEGMTEVLLSRLLKGDGETGVSMSGCKGMSGCKNTKRPKTVL